jgi:hypothetical protein
MIDFQLVVQHRAAGVLTSTNFNLDALAFRLEPMLVQCNLGFIALSAVCFTA